MTILITGISSGFGKAIADGLAKAGHRVYGTHRRDVERIEGVNYIQAEVTDEVQVGNAVNQVLEREGRIDVFISNAGMGVAGPLEFTSTDDILHQMDVNWGGMVKFLHHIIPVMRRQGYGKIICISSIGGLIGLPFQGAYSASKFAIEGYCQALRMELKSSGVKVVVVEPGDFATEFTGKRRSVTCKEADRAYPRYRTALNNVEKDESSGLKPEVLARTIGKIITDRNPKNRYIVATFLQKLSVCLKNILPSKLFEFILSKYYGM